MRYFFPLLFLSFSVFAQNECEQSVSISAKKNYKKAEDAARNWQYGKAYSFLEKALEEQSNYAKALFLYGQLKMEKQDFEHAQELLIRGVGVCPMYSAEMYWLIASMAFEAGYYDRAAQYYEFYLRFFELSEEKKVLAQERWDEARFLIEMYAMPVPYNPQPVPGISTKDDEYLPILSPDNQIAFYTRRRVKQEMGMLRAETVEEFVFSSMEGDSFNLGDLMPHPFNLHNNEGGASLTIDNNELFLTICEPVNGYNNCDIYYTTRKDSLWTPLRRLLYPVNKSDSWESQPTISSDGNTLLFTSMRPGGRGGADIYSVSRTESGSWGNLQSLSINTLGDEKSPFLHPDNQTLYFSSNGYKGLGGLDIFYVKKDTAGNWGEPQNIGYPINSEADDLGLFVSTDGKTAYFASSKLEGKGGWDVYHFPLYKEARPERVLFLKGDVLNEFGEPIVSSVEIKSMKDNSVFEVDVDVETGRYVAAVSLDKDEDVMVTVKDDFYAFKSQYVSATDEDFESPEKLDFDMEKIREGEAFRINNIYFETDSFSLNQQAKNVLSAFVSFLQNRKDLKVAIHGHTDSAGDDEANLLLSTKRAQSVHNFLIASGVASVRLSYKGFGEQKPLETNMTQEGRSNNRRTEFYIVEKQVQKNTTK